ncbi:glycoside hydrolase superfamily [Hypoxylon crocopeplum]|nr:glycoside hydrolase superfamily [Hypoxylon crocopeplum]
MPSLKIFATAAIATFQVILADPSNHVVTTPTPWPDAIAKAQDFVSQLNLTEKIGIVSGGYLSGGPACVGAIGQITRLGFKGICLSDGPSGYSRSDSVSVFPSGITTAATWDASLMYRRAVALGEEFRAKGSHVILGPAAGPMGRHARGGRNWEGFGPDPYLAGVSMNATVSGIQSTGVQACSKHMIGNEQETQRTSTTSSDGTVVEAISSNIDDRTLHELYLWPFANAINAGTSSLMCSYNRFNGNYTCANSELLSEIVKDKLKFPGYVVSDWYATHATADSANAGLDLEMPGAVSAEAGPAYFGDLLLEAVQARLVSESRLDDMAQRVMAPYFRLGQDSGFPSVDPSAGAVFLTYQYGQNSPLFQYYPKIAARDVRGDHAAVIREIGAAGTVLLKNVNNILPLKNVTNVGVFGNDADYPSIGSVNSIDNHPEGFQSGTLDIGGGSGTVRHTDLVTPLEAVQEKVKSLGGRAQIILDNDLIAEGIFKSIYPVPDVCLLFLKAYATEGTDRTSLDLQWNSTMAVESTAAMCPNTVVIVHGPGVVLLPWADNENVTAILAAHYPGEQTGHSIVDVLWGAAEPSGRLPYSIPKTLADYGPDVVDSAEYPGPGGWQADFNEGQMTDYRYLDAKNITPQYEFGFGLTYSPFEMSTTLDVEIAHNLSSLPDESNGVEPGGLVDLWNYIAAVSVQVTNNGQKESFAVPQLYVSFPQDTTPKGTPVKVLRGFSKALMMAGETKAVRFELMRRDLSFWDSSTKQWTIPGGPFTFMAGFSSRDLMAVATQSILP